jgi:hypothetical protein
MTKEERLEYAQRLKDLRDKLEKQTLFLAQINKLFAIPNYNLYILTTYC